MDESRITAEALRSQVSHPPEVPDDVRKKIQLLLLFRHGDIGCTFSALADDYLVFFNEPLFPERFGFPKWELMLKSMSDEVEVQSFRKRKVVVAKPMGHFHTVEFLQRIFHPPTAIIAGRGNLDRSQNGESQVLETAPGPRETFGESSSDLEPKTEPSSPDSTSRSLDLSTTVEVGNLPCGSGRRNSCNDLLSGNEGKSSDNQLSGNHGNLGAKQQSSVKQNIGKGQSLLETNGNDSDEEVMIVFDKLEASHIPRENNNALVVKAERDAIDESPACSSNENSVATQNQSPQTNSYTTNEVVVKEEAGSTSGEGLDATVDIKSPVELMDNMTERSQPDSATEVKEQNRTDSEFEVKNEVKEEIEEDVKPDIKEEDTGKDEKPSDPLDDSEGEPLDSQLDEKERELLRFLESPMASETTESDTRDSDTAVNETAEDTLPDNYQNPERIPAAASNESDPAPRPSPVIPPLASDFPLNLQSLLKLFVPTLASMTDSPKIPQVSPHSDQISMARPQGISQSTAKEGMHTNPSPQGDPPASEMPSVSRRSTRLKKGAEIMTNLEPTLVELNDEDEKESASGTQAASPPPPNIPTTVTAPAPGKRRISSAYPGPSSAIDKNKRARMSPDLFDSVNETQWFDCDECPTVFASFAFTTPFFVRKPKNCEISPRQFLRANAEYHYYGQGKQPQSKFVKDLEALRDDYISKPDIMCLHPFFPVAIESFRNSPFAVKTNNESDSFMFKMSFESIQLVNLSADLGLDISRQSYQGKIIYVSCYGHFEDYFMWKHPGEAKGVGYTPSIFGGQSAFAEERKFEETFVSVPICDSGNGAEVNIFDPFSRAELEDIVRSNVPEPGVDIFVANGMGFDGMPDRPQDLCLAQFQLALKLLREDGTFILKLEDTLTNFGVGLIRLISLGFKNFCMYKPVSGMPGERFLVCRGRNPMEQIMSVQHYLANCWEFVEEEYFKGGTREIFQFFSEEPTYEYLKDKKEFMRYIRTQNKLIGNRELDEWKNYGEIKKTMNEDKFKELAQTRARLWDTWRFKLLGFGSPEELWNEKISKAENTCIRERGEKSVVRVIKGYSKPQGYIDQWKCVLSSGAANRFIIIASAGKVYKYSLKQKTWDEIPGLYLPDSTIVYGDLFMSSEGATLNIIDGAMLGENDIRNDSFDRRRSACAQFAANIRGNECSWWKTVIVEAFPLSQLAVNLQKLANTKGKYHVKNPRNNFLEAPPAPSDTVKLMEFSPKEVLLLQVKPVSDLTHNAATRGNDGADLKFVMGNRLFWEWNPRSSLAKSAAAIPEEIKEDNYCCLSLFNYLANHAKN